MRDPVALLASGGLDSCVLLADLARDSTVYPIYVRNGFIWEKEEFEALQAFVCSIDNPNVEPITALFMPDQLLDRRHWSLSGIGIPSQYDSDGKTFLPGRNILLLSVAAVWCSLHHVSRIAIGTLSGNSFLDATTKFFDQFGKILSEGLAFQVHIEAPFREQCRKEDLIRKYHHTLPLELSLTCLDPKEGIHCGQCNKCRERRMGFMAAGVPDRTRYKIYPPTD